MGESLGVIQMITQTARKILVFASAIIMSALASGCSSHTVVVGPDRPTAPAAVNRSITYGEAAATVALQQVGVPYRYGGSTTSGFDCSGLVQYSYKQAGKNVARTTGQLWSSTATVERDNLQVGDVLFFRIEGKMSHVGMYVGGEKFVHAPATGRTVTVAELTTPFYSSALIRIGRPK